jgi:hypothetical protein
VKPVCTNMFYSIEGSENIIELHGSLFKTRCTGCGVVEENRDSPICESLRDKGDAKFGFNSVLVKPESKRITVPVPEPSGTDFK